MKEPKYNNNNAALYALYTTLYVNGNACEAIDEIEPFVIGKDKETQKIYGALKKRVKTYFNSVKRVATMDGLYFLSEFNGVIDGYVDTPQEMLKKTIRGLLRKHNIIDDGIICSTITAHILVEFAIKTVSTLSRELKTIDAKMSGLDGWIITEIQRVTRNLYFWVCRKIDNDKISELQNIIQPITTLYDNAIANYKNFEVAYKTAVLSERKNI